MSNPCLYLKCIAREKKWKQTKKTEKSQQNHQKKNSSRRRRRGSMGCTEWQKIIKQTLAFVSNFSFSSFGTNVIFYSFHLSLSLLPSLGFRIFYPIPLICFVCLSYLFGIFFSSLSRLLLSSTCLDIKQFNLSLMKQTVTDNSKRLLLLLFQPLQLLLLLPLSASKKAEEKREIILQFSTFFSSKRARKKAVQV